MISQQLRKRNEHPSLWLHCTQCPATLPSKYALFLLQEMLCIFLSSCPVALSDSISNITDLVSTDKLWPVKTRVQPLLLGILDSHFYWSDAISNNGNQTVWPYLNEGELWKAIYTDLLKKKALNGCNISQNVFSHCEKMCKLHQPFLNITNQCKQIVPVKDFGLTILPVPLNSACDPE